MNLESINELGKVCPNLNLTDENKTENLHKEKPIEFDISLKKSTARYKQNTEIFLVARSPTW